MDTASADTSSMTLSGEEAVECRHEVCASGSQMAWGPIPALLTSRTQSGTADLPSFCLYKMGITKTPVQFMELNGIVQVNYLVQCLAPDRSGARKYHHY